MIALLTAIILTWLHITILSVVGSPFITIQLVIVTTVLAFRYEQPRFGWQVALIAGLLFDLFSGLRFGVFASIFIITAMLSETAYSWSEKWGLNLTTWILTATCTVFYMVIVMGLAGYPFTTGLGATLISVIATTIVLQIVASILDHYNRRSG